MAEYAFYSTLARWWPVISPVEDYAEESDWIGSLLTTAVGRGSRVLELGSGGGHLSFYLSAHFDMVLSDLSEPMVEQSRKLNPGVPHVIADMRCLNLAEQFDAVLVHDAIDYMTTREDLRQAMRSARRSCRPGGTCVFVPDHVAESFSETTELSENDSPDGRSARLVEWNWDPDASDEQATTEFVFLLRSPAGEVVVHHESHVFGLFPCDVWLELCREAGLEPRAVTEVTTQDRTPRTAFVCTRR